VIKNAEPNKYVLDAVKSRDPGHAPFGRVKGHVTYFLNFGTPSITIEREKLDTSFLCWIGHCNGTDTRVPQNVFLVP